MFQNLLERMHFDVSSMMMRLQIQTAQDAPTPVENPILDNVEYRHAPADALSSGSAPQEPEQVAEANDEPFTRSDKKVGRNEPCPCGSGKKFKQCHGKLG